MDEMNTEMLRHVLRMIFITACGFLYFFGIKWGYQAYTHEDPTYCGKLFKKISSIETHKHSSSNEFIFVVDFEKHGRDEINVTASTYVSHKEGDTVCFKIRDTKITGAQICKELIAIVCYLVTAFFIIIMLIACIRWIFFGKFLD